jgi:hypothetical protein
LWILKQQMVSTKQFTKPSAKRVQPKPKHPKPKLKTGEETPNPRNKQHAMQMHVNEDANAMQPEQSEQSERCAQATCNNNNQQG